jgi:hypothetical protein
MLCKRCGGKTLSKSDSRCNDCWYKQLDTITPTKGACFTPKKRKAFVVEFDGEPTYMVDNVECDSRFLEYDQLFLIILDNQRRLEAKLDALIDRVDFTPVAPSDELEAAKARFESNTAALDNV